MDSAATPTIQRATMRAKSPSLVELSDAMRRGVRVVKESELFQPRERGYHRRKARETLVLMLKRYLIPTSLRLLDLINMSYLVGTFWTMVTGDYSITSTGNLFAVTTCLALSLDMLFLLTYIGVAAKHGRCVRAFLRSAFFSLLPGGA